MTATTAQVLHETILVVAPELQTGIFTIWTKCLTLAIFTVVFNKGRHFLIPLRTLAQATTPLSVSVMVRF